MKKYTAYVTWWEYCGDAKPKRRDDCCFLRANWAMDKLRYMAFAHQVTPESCRFFIDFLGEIFGKTHPFRGSIVQVEGHGQMVKWTLVTKGMNKTKILLYLTAFRAVAEQYRQVEYLYKNRDGKDTEGLWALFHEAHLKEIIDNTNHSLMVPDDGNYGTPKTPVDLKVFRQRLKDQSPDSVFKYFK